MLAALKNHPMNRDVVVAACRSLRQLATGDRGAGIGHAAAAAQGWLDRWRLVPCSRHFTIQAQRSSISCWFWQSCFGFSSSAAEPAAALPAMALQT